MKMDVAIYAIKVGKSMLSKLNFDNEFDIEPSSVKDNPVYDGSKKKESPQMDEELEVYDVLLAGVEIDDK